MNPTPTSWLSKEKYFSKKVQCKNKSKNDLSFAARGELEKKVAKKSAAIKKIAKKLLPMVKKADRAKMKNKNKTPGQ